MNIKMIEVTKIAALIAVAMKAIEVFFAEDAVSATHADLDEAYRTWKAERGLGRIERDGIEWQNMMRATAGVYDDLEKAKRDLRNAKKRLRTAIMKYQGWTV